MFIGRLGALTLAFAITAPTELPSLKSNTHRIGDDWLEQSFLMDKYVIIGLGVFGRALAKILSRKVLR